MESNNAYLSKKAKLNLKLFPVAKVLTKRVYLPLIAIYFVDVAGLSVYDLGVMAAIIGAVQLILEVPSGYFSDRVSRRLSIMLTGLFGLAATIVFVLFQNRTGVFIGVALEATGYAFNSGTGQAMVHDSLAYLKKEDQFSKYLSRAQSLSLIINAALIAVVPLTYVIDKRIPFILGGVQFLVLAVTGYFFTDLNKASSHKIIKPINKGWLKKHHQFILFAAIFGMLAAVYTSQSDFRNLALEQYGLRPELFGILFAAGSVFGAIIGYHFHRLKSLGVKRYAILDCTVAVLTTLGYASGNIPLTVMSFIIGMSFWRFRGIIYDDFILAHYKPRYKATLVSTLFTSTQLNGIWQPIVISLVVGGIGLQSSFLVFAAFITAVALPFTLIVGTTLSNTD